MPLLTGSVEPSPLPLLGFADVPHPERAVARGELVRIRHGVYAPAREWRELAPWNRYLARVHANALIHPDAVFSHESAAALQGMPIFGDPVTVHTLVPSRGPSRLMAGVRTHTTVGDRDIVEVSGLAMTSRADTAVDLARHRHHAIGRAAASSTLRMDASLTAEILMAINESRSSRRGRNIARWSLARATSKTESTLEDVSLAVIEWLGFPTPQLQVTFSSASGEEDRADFLWQEADLIGECDGDVKYDGRFGDARSILRKQGERDTRLRSHVRAIVHWGWAEATTFAPLRGILTGAGLRPVAPEDSAELFSLRRLLAPRRSAPGA